MKVFDPLRSPIRILAMLALLFFLVAGLAVVSFPGRPKRATDVNSTVALVQNIATAITQYPVKSWVWDRTTPDGPVKSTEYLWDLNHDGLIDGRPAVQSTDGSDGGFSAEVIASSYAGFYDMVRPTIAMRFLQKNRQILDAWGHPLHIHFAADRYGSAWFGLWSLGPDGIDGTDDDIRSWQPHRY